MSWQILRYTTGFILVYSAVAKFRSREARTVVSAQLGLLLGRRLSAIPSASVLALAELSSGVGIAASHRVALAIPALLLLIGLMAGSILLVYGGHRVKCMCFGATSAEMTWWHVGWNVVLVAGAFAAARSNSADRTLLDSAVAASLALGWTFIFVSADRIRLRLSPTKPRQYRES